MKVFVGREQTIIDLRLKSNTDGELEILDTSVRNRSPDVSRIALGRIQHRVSEEKKPARIEVRSRQTEASRFRKPLARFKTEGVTHVLSEKGSLTTGGLIEEANRTREVENS